MRIFLKNKLISSIRFVLARVALSIPGATSATANRPRLVSFLRRLRSQLSSTLTITTLVFWPLINGFCKYSGTSHHLSSTRPPNLDLCVTFDRITTLSSNFPSQRRAKSTTMLAKLTLVALAAVGSVVAQDFPIDVNKVNPATRGKFGIPS